MSSTGPAFSVEFQDCDAYFDAISHVDARFTIPRLDEHLWGISGVALPRGVEIQHCWSGSGALAHGASRCGGVELAVPATGHYVANGKVVPFESALFMWPGSEFLVSIPGSHSWFNVFVPDPQATSIGLLDDSVGASRLKTQILHNLRPQSGSVPSLLARFASSLGGAPELALSERSLARFETELLRVLGAAYGDLPERASKASASRAIVDEATIGRAVDAIEALAEPGIAMSDLQRIAGVSERSLRAGFSKYLGVSPTEYMRLSMLRKARRRLATSMPGETTVAKIATDLGAWDLGRFAMRYRQVYGELPSATLRRASAQAVGIALDGSTLPNLRILPD